MIINLLKIIKNGMQENTSSIVDKGEKCVCGGRGDDGGSIGVVCVEEREFC